MKVKMLKPLVFVFAILSVVFMVLQFKPITKNLRYYQINNSTNSYDYGSSKIEKRYILFQTHNRYLSYCKVASTHYQSLERDWYSEEFKDGYYIYKYNLKDKFILLCEPNKSYTSYPNHKDPFENIENTLFTLKIDKILYIKPFLHFILSLISLALSIFCGITLKKQNNLIQIEKTE